MFCTHACTVQIICTWEKLTDKFGRIPFGPNIAAKFVVQRIQKRFIVLFTQFTVFCTPRARCTYQCKYILSFVHSTNFLLFSYIFVNFFFTFHFYCTTIVTHNVINQFIGDYYERQRQYKIIVHSER